MTRETIIDRLLVLPGALATCERRLLDDRSNRNTRCATVARRVFLPEGASEMTNEEWISTGAAAKVLKTDRKTVLRLVERGLLVGKQVPTLTGKLWTQVERAQVERLAKHKYGWRHHRRGQRVAVGADIGGNDGP